MTETFFPFCLKVTQKPRECGFFERKHVSRKIHSKASFQESKHLRAKKRENKQKNIVTESSDHSRSLINLRKQGNSFAKTRVKTISRHDFYSSLLNNSSENILSRGKNTKKSTSGFKAGLVAYRVINDSFSKPRPAQRKTNGYALRKAVSEVKPCIDLRQVRRGRKTFQIPRIIPPVKRQLFGVRRLLSILSASAKKGVETSVKGKDSVLKRRGGVLDGNHGGVLASRKNLGNESSVNVLPISTKPGLASTETSLVDSSNKEQGLWYKNNLSTSSRYHTRTTRGKDSNSPSLSLFYALGNEVRASSRSRSRAVENKKRIYRVASANRGSIRMSWWL